MRNPGKLWSIYIGGQYAGGVRASSNASAVSKGRKKFDAEGERVVARRETPYGVSSNPGKRCNRRPKKGKPSKRIPAALSAWLKRQNPSKMRGVTKVRVKKLKAGGVTITPVR
jgi:hypothetical protein